MEAAVLAVVGKALWDPNPTTTDLQSQQLAEALGYPEGWRVARNQSDDGRLFDRIYSGDPATVGCDMWLNHAGAMEAAAKWEKTDQTQFAFKGGQLLPIKSKFDMGDKVQVLYGDEWWDAKILKRKEHSGKFKYQVYYSADSSKQTGVDEVLIRPRPTDIDPGDTASTLGFPEGWEAFSIGHNRWKIVSLEGEVYRSKKAALEALEGITKAAVDEGDPPWRKDGNEYLGRRVRHATEHRVSARRTVHIEQIGTVTGWISESDVDKEGKPGFVSEKTGQPSRLYHVKFDVNRHEAYADHQLSEQDLEEYELLEKLLPEDQGPPAKKQRTE